MALATPTTIRTDAGNRRVYPGPPWSAIVREKDLRELVGQTRLDQVGVKERGVIAGFILRPSGQRDQRGLTLIRTGADLARESQAVSIRQAMVDHHGVEDNRHEDLQRSTHGARGVRAVAETGEVLRIELCRVVMILDDQHERVGGVSQGLSSLPRA